MLAFALFYNTCGRWIQRRFTPKSPTASVY
nr:MAG TPA: hypothetical protein [Caudoviricetes sp.]